MSGFRTETTASSHNRSADIPFVSLVGHRETMPKKCLIIVSLLILLLLVAIRKDSSIHFIEKSERDRKTPAEVDNSLISDIIR